MDKIELKSFRSKFFQNIQELHENQEHLDFEKILGLVKNSNSEEVNAKRVQELKAKVANNQYSVDFDAVGEEIFKEFVQEL